MQTIIRLSGVNYDLVISEDAATCSVTKSDNNLDSMNFYSSICSDRVLGWPLTCYEWTKKIEVAMKTTPLQKTES